MDRKQPSAEPTTAAQTSGSRNTEQNESNALKSTETTKLKPAQDSYEQMRVQPGKRKKRNFIILY
ncbi:MAG: hypothetical protein IJZ80_08420 [Clostridia bacterium]|nr:hypothetical protein [Clostridia bacterium]